MKLTNPKSHPTVASGTTDILDGNRGLLTKLLAGEWLPLTPEEVVATLILLTEEVQAAHGATRGLLGDYTRPAVRRAWE
jgi:hypothetical protein